jgi:7,8-dihydroneopterin aldolase/epimerase/oxygenase
LVNLIESELNIMGKIGLEGLKFHGYIGLYEQEKQIGNIYIVDIYIDTNFNEIALKNDQLSGTIDYEKIYEVVKKCMSAKANLLEHAANNIINEIIKISNEIKVIRVRLAKNNPPFKGEAEKVFIELERKI